MSNVTPKNEIVYIPGVYGLVQVVSSLPGAPPEMLIPVLMGEQDQGIPYNYLSLKASNEATRSPFVFLGTTTAVKAEAGPDSDMAQAMGWAAKHGLPGAYLLCASPLTRAKVIAVSTGPVNQFTLFSRTFGAVGGHIKIAVTGGNKITITPVKRYSLLTAEAVATAKRVYVKDHTWIKIGATVQIGANNVANAGYVVADKGTELNASGQNQYWIDLTTGLASDLDADQYPMVLIYDTDQIEAPDAFTNTQALYDWLNASSRYLAAVKHADWTGAALTNTTEKPLKEVSAWGTVTKGTSPAATSTDYEAIIAALDASEWDRFLQTYQVQPYVFGILNSTAAIHALFRDWAVTKRAAGEPVQFITGCAWGDTVIGAGDSTDPSYRAGVLNSQDMILCAGGLDKKAAYLSLAPAVLGRLVGGGIGHNLTNDPILYSEVEAVWDERSSGELTTLHKKGVVTYRIQAARPFRYVISQGLNTLQANDVAWNEGSNDTSLIMQREIADFIDRTIKARLNTTQIGADEVTASTVSVAARITFEYLKVQRALISSYQITSIRLNATGNGYDVVWSVRLRTTVDFINYTTQILIGE